MEQAGPRLGKKPWPRSLPCNTMEDWRLQCLKGFRTLLNKYLCTDQTLEKLAFPFSLSGEEITFLKELFLQINLHTSHLWSSSDSTNVKTAQYLCKMFHCTAIAGIYHKSSTVSRNPFLSRDFKLLLIQHHIPSVERRLFRCEVLNEIIILPGGDSSYGSFCSWPHLNCREGQGGFRPGQPQAPIPSLGTLFSTPLILFQVKSVHSMVPCLVMVPCPSISVWYLFILKSPALVPAIY